YTCCSRAITLLLARNPPVLRTNTDLISQPWPANWAGRLICNQAPSSPFQYGLLVERTLTPGVRHICASCQRLCPWASSVLSMGIDRKSTRLNSSHVKSSYAVFCL